MLSHFDDIDQCLIPLILPFLSHVHITVGGPFSPQVFLGLLDRSHGAAKELGGSILKLLAANGLRASSLMRTTSIMVLDGTGWYWMVLDDCS